MIQKYSPNGAKIYSSETQKMVKFNNMKITVKTLVAKDKEKCRRQL